MESVLSSDDNVQCSECGRCFIHDVTLQRHRKYSCKPRVVFECPSCKGEFESGSYLDQHLIRHKLDEVCKAEEAKPEHCSKQDMKHDGSTPERQSPYSDNEQYPSSSDDEKLQIVERTPGVFPSKRQLAKRKNCRIGAKDKKTMLPRSPRSPLKMILKVKNVAAPENGAKESNKDIHQEKKTGQITNGLQFDGSNISEHKDIIQSILEMLKTTFRNGYCGMKAGELAVLTVDNNSCALRVVKVIKIADAVLKALPYTVNKTRLIFSKQSEVVPLSSVLCHGQFAFPKGRPRKQDSGQRKYLLMQLEFLPKVFHMVLNSPNDIVAMNLESLVPKWMTNCCVGEEAKVIRNEKSERVDGSLGSQSDRAEKSRNCSNKSQEDCATNVPVDEKQCKSEDKVLTSETDNIGAKICENDTEKQTSTEENRSKGVKKETAETGITKLRTYPCRVCRRCFVYKETRDCHESVICRHDHERPALRCPMCHWELECSRDYDMHTIMKCSPRKNIQKIQDPSPQICHYCQKQFIHTSTLSTHLHYCCTKFPKA